MSIAPLQTLQVRFKNPFNATSTFSLNRAQLSKITALAIASFSLLFLQLGTSLPVAVGVSLALSNITWISEKLRTNPSEWFNVKNIDQKNLLKNLGFYLVILPIYVGVVYSWLGVPAQLLAQKLLAGHLKTILIATIVAPVVEEILFRGFVQERIEDLLHLTGRYIYPIKESSKKSISCFAQALIFGACHIVGKQVTGGALLKTMVLGATTFSGFYFGSQKNKDKSLITPIILHAANNTGLTIGLLAFRSQILRA